MKPREPERLAEGVFEVTNDDRSVDYVFISGRQPIDYSHDGIVFHGTAGSIHIDEGGLALCLLDGDRIGYQNSVFEAETGLSLSDEKIEITLYGPAFENHAFEGDWQHGLVP